MLNSLSDMDSAIFCAGKYVVNIFLEQLLLLLCFLMNLMDARIRSGSKGSDSCTCSPFEYRKPLNGYFYKNNVAFHVCKGKNNLQTNEYNIFF